MVWTPRHPLATLFIWSWDGFARFGVLMPRSRVEGNGCRHLGLQVLAILVESALVLLAGLLLLCWPVPASTAPYLFDLRRSSQSFFGSFNGG